MNKKLPRIERYQKNAQNISNQVEHKADAGDAIDFVHFRTNERPCGETHDHHGSELGRKEYIHPTGTYGRKSNAFVIMKAGWKVQIAD